MPDVSWNSLQEALDSSTETVERWEQRLKEAERLYNEKEAERLQAEAEARRLEQLVLDLIDYACAGGA